MESSQKHRRKNYKRGNIKHAEIFFRREGEATNRGVNKHAFIGKIMMKESDAASMLIYWFNLIFILKLKDVSLYIRVAKMLDWNTYLPIMQVNGKKSPYLPELFEVLLPLVHHQAVSFRRKLPQLQSAPWSFHAGELPKPLQRALRYPRESRQSRQFSTE